MSSIMKGLQGPMSEEMDDDEFDAMVARLKQKAAKQEKLKAQGKEPVTKQDPKTGKYYVDFDDEQVKETSSTGQGGGSAGIGGGAGLGIDKSPMEKILEKPLGESDISEDTIRPALAAKLKELGLKGPYKLSQLPKWSKELIHDDEYGFDANTMIMVGGNDPFLDEFVAKTYDYGYIYGAEGGLNVQLTAKEVLDRVSPMDMDEHIGSPGGMGQSYRKFKPKSAGVSESSERTDNLISILNSWGYYTDDGRLYINDKNGDKIIRLGSNWKHLSSGKVGNGPDELDILLNKQGVSEGSIHQGDLYNAVIEYFRSDRGYRNAMILRKKAQAGTSAEELATLLNNFSAKKWGTKLTPSDAVDAVKNIVYPHRFEQDVEEGKLGTALGAIGLGAMMAMNPAHADVKTSDVNVSKDSQTTTRTQPSAINYKQDKVYKAIQNALEDMHPKWDYNMLNQFSYHTYKNYKETGKLDSEIVNYYKVMQSDQAPTPGFSKKWDAAVADQVKEDDVNEAGYRGRSSFPRTDAWGRQERAREENRALTRVYRYDSVSGRVKETSVPYNQISQYYAQGWKDFPEDTLRANKIIRSKFDPKKFVQKVGDKWVQVYPYGKPEDVAESPDASDKPTSIEQLATISDQALDDAYHYGRSSPGNTFGWQANLKSAEFAKKAIESGITDIDKISDAIHRGWNMTAKAFVQNPDQFDDTAKLKAAGKLEAKLAQREKLMNINYAQLPEDEKEKDRVVARALLQAIKGGQGVAEEQAPMFTPEDKMVNANNPTGTGWRFYKAVPAGAKKSAIMKGLQKEETMTEYELGGQRKIVFSKENPPSLDFLYQQFIHQMLSSENILEPKDWIERVNKHYGLNYTWKDYQNRGRNDHTDNWQKIVKKYIVKIK